MFSSVWNHIRISLTLNYTISCNETLILGYQALWLILCNSSEKIKIKANSDRGHSAAFHQVMLFSWQRPCSFRKKKTCSKAAWIVHACEMLSVKFFIFFILRKFELSKRTRRGRPINVSLGATPHLLPLTEWIELLKKPISDYDHQPHKSQFIVLNWIEQKGFQSLQEAMPNTHMKFRIVLQWPSLMHIVWFEDKHPALV